MHPSNEEPEGPEMDPEKEKGVSLLQRPPPAPDSDDEGDVFCLDDPKVWRWLVVGAVFVMTFMHGIERTMSLYYVELMEYFETDSSVISLIGSIFYTFYCFSGIIVLPLSERYGPRSIVMIGGVFLCIGPMVTAFAPNVYVCIAGFGFFIGTGCAMVYMNATTVLVFYFPQKNMIAQGIGVSGQAAGGILLPILIQYLNERYSWRGGLIIVAGVVLNVCIAGALVRPIKSNHSKSHDISLAEIPAPGRGSILRTVKELLYLKSFLLLCLQNTFFQASMSILGLHMKAAVLENTGVKDEYGSFVVSLYGAAHFIGLIVTGVLAHVTNVEPMILFQIHVVVCATGAILVPVWRHYAAMATFLCVFAFNTSVTGSILPILICDLVGEKRLRLAWAIRFFFCGIGGLSGPVLAGILYDHTKDYSNSMYVAGSGLMLSFFWMIKPCVDLIRHRKKKRVEKPEDVIQSLASLPGSLSL